MPRAIDQSPGSHADPDRREHSAERVREFFRVVARSASNAIGSPFAFIGAVLLIVLWGASGPWFHYSETWQLIINTGTTIVTFLVVFMIQNTQNHDSRAIQLKLDELIRAMKSARNTMVDLEDLPDEELTRLEREMKAIRTGRRGASRAGDARTDAKRA
ncbi:MAG: low affinity iron permease family protein [Kofleriaceae bacterium]